MQQGPSGTKVPTFGMCRTITSLSQRNRTTKRAWGVGGERGGGGGRNPLPTMAKFRGHKPYESEDMNF